MTHDELIKAQRRLKVETGSLACLGCGHEHNCSTHGCAILREAAEALEKSAPVVRCGECKMHGNCYAEDVFAVARLDDNKRFCGVGQRREEDNNGGHQPDT